VARWPPTSSSTRRTTARTTPPHGTQPSSTSVDTCRDLRRWAPLQQLSPTPHRHRRPNPRQRAHNSTGNYTWRRGRRERGRPRRRINVRMATCDRFQPDYCSCSKPLKRVQDPQRRAASAVVNYPWRGKQPVRRRWVTKALLSHAMERPGSAIRISFRL
jgi:hypothetical protein